MHYKKYPNSILFWIKFFKNWKVDFSKYFINSYKSIYAILILPSGHQSLKYLLSVPQKPVLYNRFYNWCEFYNLLIGVCMYVCACLCVYVCICVWVYISVYVCAGMCICTCVHTCVYVSMCQFGIFLLVEVVLIVTSWIAPNNYYYLFLCSSSYGW